MQQNALHSHSPPPTSHLPFPFMSVHMSAHRPIGRLKAGDVFGELSLLDLQDSRYVCVFRRRRKEGRGRGGGGDAKDNDDGDDDIDDGGNDTTIEMFL